VLKLAAEALHFDGTNDKVIGTNSLLPQGSAARTFTAWINPSRVTGASQTIFHYGNEATASASGLLIANGNLYYVGHFSDFDGGALQQQLLQMYGLMLHLRLLEKQLSFM
jgi:hypothetical protein